MASKKKTGKKCDICLRDTLNDRALGRLQETRTITAHVNCVLFSPVSPDKTSLTSRPEDDGIAGVTSRFVRQEGKRAKKLVFQIFHFFCSHSLTHTFLSTLNHQFRYVITANLLAPTLVAVLILATIRCRNSAVKSITSTVDTKREQLSTLV